MTKKRKLLEKFSLAHRTFKAEGKPIPEPRYRPAIYQTAS
jgi:hypothetical protein